MDGTQVIERADGAAPWNRSQAEDASQRHPCSICPVRSRVPCGLARDAAAFAALEIARSTPRWIASGQQIREPVDLDGRVYTVLQGWVALQEDLVDGRTMILRFATAGDMLTIEPATLHSARSVVALGPALICSFTQTRHRRLLAEWPEFAEQWHSRVEHDLQLAYAHLAEMAVGSARRHVAALIWELAFRSLRRAPRPSDRIHMPISQIHIGAATGLTAVHVSRTLSGLRDEGLLEMRGHVISIHDPAAVARLSGVPEEVMAHWC